jgi:hypothetical protein
MANYERATDEEIAAEGENMTLATAPGLDDATQQQMIAHEDAWRRREARSTALHLAVATSGKKPKAEEVVARAEAFVAFLEG